MDWVTMRMAPAVFALCGLAQIALALITPTSRKAKVGFACAGAIVAIIALSHLPPVWRWGIVGYSIIVSVPMMLWLGKALRDESRGR